MKTLTVSQKEVDSKGIDLSIFPNFHRTGSTKGMKKLYYGRDALLVKCGSYIYNVDEKTYNLLN